MISSSHNPKIQWVHALQTKSRQRVKDKAFIIEGVRLVEEAQQSGWNILLLLYTDDIDPRSRSILQKLSDTGTPCEEVTSQVMRLVSDTTAPQGILAVVEQKNLLPDHNIDFVFIPDAIRDPGNLGTMLRTAHAAGCDAVFVPKGTVDIYSPKVVRSAMGAHFHLPMRMLTWKEIEEVVHKHGLHVFLADSNSGRPYTQVDYKQPLALIVGGEAEGAGSEAQQLSDERLIIPMPGNAESLNAAIAAGILLFTIVQKRTSPS